jgi:hypothetical protein
MELFLTKNNFIVFKNFPIIPFCSITTNVRNLLINKFSIENYCPSSVVSYSSPKFQLFKHNVYVNEIIVSIVFLLDEYQNFGSHSIISEEEFEEWEGCLDITSTENFLTLLWMRGLISSEFSCLRTTRRIFPEKPRSTTEWMEICNTIGNTGLNKLRNIVIQHVTESNFSNIRNYFHYDGEFERFKDYVFELSKRQLGVYLARYYENSKDLVYDIPQIFVNTQTILGDDLNKLPFERIMILEEFGKKYGFDVFEISKLNGQNPYTRKKFPDSFVKLSEEKLRSLPKDINGLVLRNSTKGNTKEKIRELTNKILDTYHYFPVRRFNFLGKKGLFRLGSVLSEYDLNFSVYILQNELYRGILQGKIYILKRIVKFPEELGHIVEIFFLK